MARILETSVLAALEDEAPKVTIPSYETHKAIVRALVMWSSAHPISGADENGRAYWIAALQDLIPLTGINNLPPQHVGTACRNFCLSMRRMPEGYHTAWSQKQLDILRKAFGLEVTK